MLIYCYFLLFLVISCYLLLCVLVCFIYDLLFLHSSLFLFSFLLLFFLLRSLLLLSSICFLCRSLLLLFSIPSTSTNLSSPLPFLSQYLSRSSLLHVPTVPDWVRTITVTYSFPDEPCVTRFCVEVNRTEPNRVPGY